MTQRRSAVACLAVAAVGLVVAAPGSAAAGGAPPDPGQVVWEHGGSNMGECSAYLAQLDVPGVTNVRAEVNQIINDYGSFLGIPDPGALYSVRARQADNLPPAQECLARSLPGGGTG